MCSTRRSSRSRRRWCSARRCCRASSSPASSRGRTRSRRWRSCAGRGSMRAPDPGRGRALLAGWLAASFALSAVTDWRLLAIALAVALALLPRGAPAHLARVARLVLPLSLGGAAAGVLFERLAGRAGPAWEALLALNLRAVLLALLVLAGRNAREVADALRARGF